MQAIQGTPEITGKRAPALTLEEIFTLLSQGHFVEFEQGVTQMMASHPSDKVKQTGTALIQAVEARRKVDSKVLQAGLPATLAKVRVAITHARMPSDLDATLAELQALMSDPRSGYGLSQQSINEVNVANQFVTLWQDYLAGVDKKDFDLQRRSLNQILNDRQPTSPTFFPRSKILERLIAADQGITFTEDAPPKAKATLDVDTILAAVHKPEDLGAAIAELGRIRTSPPEVRWEWSNLVDLETARWNAHAGLAVSLDLNEIMQSALRGPDVSRITAMDLLQILPFYFGAQDLDPPKNSETVAGYLDRLSDTASTQGNLALLQRVLSVKVAIATSDDNQLKGTRLFLAGLSQEAAGQFFPAVATFERALESPDAFLPTKLIGQQLASIKSAHPDEYEKGLASFLKPPSIYDPQSADPMMPYFSPVPRRGGFRNPVLPIPMSLDIPASKSDSAAKKSDKK